MRTAVKSKNESNKLGELVNSNRGTRTKQQYGAGLQKYVCRETFLGKAGLLFARGMSARKIVVRLLRAKVLSI
jgi:hypothetical protein